MAGRRAEPVDEGTPNRRRTLGELKSKLRKALDFDGWGQPVEALDHYRRVLQSISFECAVNRHLLQDNEKLILKDLQQAIQLRCQTLQEAAESEAVSLDNLWKASTVLSDLMSGKDVEKFPIDLPHTQSGPMSPSSMSSGDEMTSEGHFELPVQQTTGSLLPCPVIEPGLTLLIVHIGKIGLKDAGQHIDPIITISVKDISGEDMAVSQDTPIACNKEDLYVHFDVDVFIPKPVEKLSGSGAIFFEFKHYKPKKGKYSTRCFAFLEMDEIKSGPACLELYQKPTNFKRRKLNLFTVKPLFLHLDLSLQRS